MATMIPEFFTGTGGGAKAEGMLFDALRDKLDDDWRVYWSIHFVDGDAVGEGECDFTLVHPQHGLFVIECKGRNVKCQSDGRWMRKTGPQWKRTNDPLVQAQNGVKVLRRKLKDRMGKHLPKLGHFPLVTGHAAAFPRTAKSDLCEVPLNWDPALFIDCDDLLRMGEWVKELATFWKRISDQRAAAENRPAPKGMKDEDFHIFCKRMLFPELRIAPSTRAHLIGEKHVMLALSEQQRYVAEQILDNDQMNILGGAGTGKTVVALEAARLLAEEGHRVLLLCFNRALANQLYAATREIQPRPSSIWASSFHGLCSYAARKLGIKELTVPPDKDAAKAYWRQDAPMLILEGVAADKIPRFDAIVVDEGQDFPADWWSVLDELYTADGPRKRFVFHDPGQDIFRQGNAVPEAPVLRLARNFRNTKAVGGVVNGLSELNTKPHARAPMGEPPVFIPLPRPAKLVRNLEERIPQIINAGFKPEEITILTLHKLSNSPLEGITELGGVPLVGHRNAAPGAIRHSTISSFKGLEADVIILIEASAEDALATREMRYVAASRCRHRLILYGEENWLKETV